MGGCPFPFREFCFAVGTYAKWNAAKAGAPLRIRGVKRYPPDRSGPPNGSWTAWVVSVEPNTVRTVRITTIYTLRDLPMIPLRDTTIYTVATI